MSTNRFLRIAGDYTSWNVYRKSVIICDVTEMFINRALPRTSRTVDQMRQAARSCKQNIVEGTADATVSTEMCIKLLGVARGSLRELREDYGDYLRQQKLTIWPTNDPRTDATRRYCKGHDDPREFVEKCEARSNEAVANIMLTQILQLDAMLAKVLKQIETSFISNGGLREAMTRTRLQARAAQPQPGPPSSSPSDPQPGPPSSPLRR